MGYMYQKTSSALSVEFTVLIIIAKYEIPRHWVTNLPFSLLLRNMRYRDTEWRTYRSHYCCEILDSGRRWVPWVTSSWQSRRISPRNHTWHTLQGNTKAEVLVTKSEMSYLDKYVSWNARADPGFEVRGGANGLEKLKSGGLIYFEYTIILVYIFQLRYTSNVIFIPILSY